MTCPAAGAARKERRAAERAERKRKPGKQPGAPGAAMRWRKADEVTGHFPQGDCACGADLADAADLGVARSYQQEDIPEPQPSRRYQHDLHKARCACGRVDVAPRPAGCRTRRCPSAPGCRRWRSTCQCSSTSRSSGRSS